MIENVNLRVAPAVSSNLKQLKKTAATRLGIPADQINDARVVRRSIDARQKKVWINLTLRCALGDDERVDAEQKPIEFSPVPDQAPVMVIVGAGPAGLFAALKAIRLGIRPIVIERGKDVDQRRLDIAAISREKRINPTSNYCFGEGGAGAYSDGKLYTRSKKRGNVEEVLQIFVQHGASPDILIDAHPHIGSDRLPHVIKEMRHTIIRCGGEVRFSETVTGIIVEHGEAKGVKLADGSDVAGDAVILATGHSAHDTFRALAKDNIPIEPKGVAIGVRLEHPQELIDRIQYHSAEGRGKYLPAAEYSFVTQVDGRGVYSFCMCPGGVVVPAGSGEHELVVNGMSASARSGKWANSGMVVEIHPGDFPEYSADGAMEMLSLQEALERKMFEASGNSIIAPAQRMKDFTERKLSADLPQSSYAPGIESKDFNKLLPDFIARRLRDGFKRFGEMSRGFLTNDAILIGLESRTSSPIRIVRDKETLESVGVKRLYPAGEGAGYAGGIASAAIDGMRCVEQFRINYSNS